MAPTSDRIALISDVHGNLTALEAVLDDIDARGITRIFNLGDYVGKGPRGREVIDLCRERCEVNILGNWDDFLPDPGREFDSPALCSGGSTSSPRGRATGSARCRSAHDFPLSGRQVRLMHASAETVHRRVRYVHDEAEFLGQFANTPATGDGPIPDVVGYGDTHDPFYETPAPRAHACSTPAASATAWATRHRSTASSRASWTAPTPRPSRWPSSASRTTSRPSSPTRARSAPRSTPATSPSSAAASTAVTMTEYADDAALDTYYHDVLVR